MQRSVSDGDAQAIYFPSKARQSMQSARPVQLMTSPQ